MKMLFLIAALGVALLAVACSPHRSWYHGGCGGYGGYWSNQAYDSYPAHYHGSRHPYAEARN